MVAQNPETCFSRVIPILRDIPKLFLPVLNIYFKIFLSGQRDSNARHSPWQGDALPLSYARKLFFTLL